MSVQDWEAPYMDALAAVVSSQPGPVLEATAFQANSTSPALSFLPGAFEAQVGYGLGLSAAAIATCRPLVEARYLLTYIMQKCLPDGRCSRIKGLNDRTSLKIGSSGMQASTKVNHGMRLALRTWTKLLRNLSPL